MKKVKEKGMEIVFLIAACVSILSVALICIFLFMNGIPAIKEIEFFNFVGGKIWKPGTTCSRVWKRLSTRWPTVLKQAK